MKNSTKRGHSARRGNRTSPYSKYDKRPFNYGGEPRLANGTLKHKANDKLSNKYRMV